MRKALSILLGFIPTISIAATTPHYAMMIDGGSTSTKLHLYQYSQDKNNEWLIQEIYADKTTPGLSAYATHPELAGQALKNLFDNAHNKLQSINVADNDVSISILSTAGMRLLDEKTRHEIQQNVHQYLALHYAFSIDQIATMPGKMEGAYAWLAVNYRENTLSEDSETLGIIDMGGASTQIAYQTDDTSKPEDEILFTYNNHTYTIFSKSFLGLGLNEARRSLESHPTAGSCYPTDYFFNNPGKNHFNFSECSTTYQNIIAHFDIPSQLLPLYHGKFAVFSGAYYVYNFFGVEDNSREALEARTRLICAMTWEQMKAEYKDSNIPENILATYCADSIYLSNLFYDSYHLSANQMWVTNKTHDRQNIDWTLGALLYKVNT